MACQAAAAAKYLSSVPCKPVTIVGLLSRLYWETTQVSSHLKPSIEVIRVAHNDILR